MKLFFVRHGESEANLAMRYAGQSDAKLTEKGREQAVKIRPVLADIPFDRVYSSDLSRAYETQELAIPGADAIKTPLLREFNVGVLTGRDYVSFEKTAMETITKNRDYREYGGESADMVCDRVKEFLAHLEENPCENVAAFAHNGVLICMLRNVIGTAFDYSSVRSGNCAIHVFEYVNGKWRLLAWNYKADV